MNSIYDEAVPKKTTNLSINSDLLAKSRDIEINLLALLEAALKAKLAASANDKWKKKTPWRLRPTTRTWKNKVVLATQNVISDGAIRRL